MKVKEGKKIYFASDNHLGAPNSEISLVREKVLGQSPENSLP